ncbi:MAG: hypothetical protein B7Y41_07090 [Hydrogenophilales bacterium 28-61-23]|nr:MAG: hypothetical protein B7Y41_07090 [Hydrogenophilales bacterium 28-61-23]
MKHIILFAAISCLTLPVHAEQSGFALPPLPQFPDFTPVPLSRPSHTETFVIDPSQSYVKAYVANWTKGSGSEPIFTVEGGEPQPAAFNLELHWTQTTFSLAGAFNMETVPSEWDWDRSRLFTSQIQIATDAPSYAAFGLPTFFAQFGQAVSYSSNPCFDHNFADPPGWSSSCSGWQRGPTREDNGTLQGNILAVHGLVSSYFSPMVLSLPGTVEPPALPTDFSAVQGVFEYHLVAVAAVPEPETYALMLAGIGLVSFAARRWRV